MNSIIINNQEHSIPEGIDFWMTRTMDYIKDSWKLVDVDKYQELPAGAVECVLMFYVGDGSKKLNTISMKNDVCDRRSVYDIGLSRVEMLIHTPENRQCPHGDMCPLSDTKKDMTTIYNNNNNFTRIIELYMFWDKKDDYTKHISDIISTGMNNG